MRERLSDEIKSSAVAWHVEYVSPREIDNVGIGCALRRAFRRAIDEIESSEVEVKAVLLDGNPLHIDDREVNIVKGDSKCAPIAAASIVAKVERDHLMERYAADYPQYGFESNKGYGTDFHREAIRKHGLTDIHRKSFCSEFLQDSLF